MRKQDKWGGLPHAGTCRLLESAGIDPMNVSNTGLDFSGYFVFERDDEGHKVIDPRGEFRRWFKNWGNLPQQKIIEIVETYQREGGK